MIQVYQNEIASLKAQLAAIQLPSIPDLPELEEDDSEDLDQEVLNSERERLREVQLERARVRPASSFLPISLLKLNSLVVSSFQFEQEVSQLELKRTKLQSQITTM